MNTLFINLMSSAITLFTGDIQNPEYMTARPLQTKITEVQMKEHATTVYFSVPCKAGDRGNMPSAYYLSDEKDHHYKTLGSTGVVLDSIYTFDTDTTWCFSVDFEKLPETCREFDCIDGTLAYGAENFYRIRQGKTDNVTNEQKPVDAWRTESVFPESSFQIGEVTLSGHITGMQTDSVSIFLPNLYGMSYHFQYYHHKRIHHMRVRPDGSFEIKLPVDGPCWTDVYLSKDKMWIPIILLPGDHLEVNIENCGQRDMKVTYGGASSKFSNFLNHIPLLPIYSFPDDAGEGYDKKVETEYDNLMSLCEYLSAKHGFTAGERNLLRTECCMYLGYKYLFYMSEMWHAKKPMPAYTFLKHLPYGSPDVMTVPSMTVVPSWLRYIFTDIADGLAEETPYLTSLYDYLTQSFDRLRELSALPSGHINYIVDHYRLYMLSDIKMDNVPDENKAKYLQLISICTDNMKSTLHKQMTKRALEE